MKLIQNIKLQGNHMRIIALVIACSFGIAACGSHSKVISAMPVGKAFPSIVTTSLAGDQVTLPTDYLNRPTVFLIAYKQEAQFDIDRWILGLLQLETPANIIEIPTMLGVAPRIISNMIEDGMRRGIPEINWGSVVTVYSNADQIVELIGNQHPHNAQVILLDRQGKVRWFHNRGYSPALALELDALVLNGIK